MRFSRGLTVVPSLAARGTARLGIALMALVKLQGDLCTRCHKQHLCQLPWAVLPAGAGAAPARGHSLQVGLCLTARMDLGMGEPQALLQVVAPRLVAAVAPGTPRLC